MRGDARLLAGDSLFGRTGLQGYCDFSVARLDKVTDVLIKAELQPHDEVLLLLRKRQE